jgi:hypothetical protein
LSDKFRNGEEALAVVIHWGELKRRPIASCQRVESGEERNGDDGSQHIPAIAKPLAQRLVTCGLRDVDILGYVTAKAFQDSRFYVDAILLVLENMTNLRDS